mgnify:CR=1 FL=1
MNIILVSNSFAKARSVTLGGKHLLLLAIMAAFIFIIAVFSAQYLIIRFQPETMSSQMRSWLANVQTEGELKRQTYMREGMDTMAMRLGQLQAQLMRLDTLGVRLAKLSGMKPHEFDFTQAPAQGGPFIPISSQPGQEFSLAAMKQQLDTLTILLNDRNDKLVALETLLMQDRLTKKQFLSAAPTSGGWYSSNFGWRIDPFTGQNAMHEGVDFVTPEGAPIFAAAGGIVAFSDYHPQYGNMVELDHGNDVITRYAHASRLLVKVGQVVRRGQEIAKVGSTGRSTGNHLHFEVRFKGIAQNPTRFLPGTSS